jgi:hypothetical protein
VLERLDDLRHLGGQLGREGTAGALVTYRELDGPGSLRYLVSADEGKTLAAAILEGATQRLGRRVVHLRDLGKDALLALPPEEQYLVATGRTYFRGLSFDQLHRIQFDLETTGLDAGRDRIFMVAVRDPSGATEVLEAFLRRSIARLLTGDVSGVRDIYVATLDALRRRELPPYDVSSKVRLTKTPAQYLDTRETRREMSYEAMLASGRTSWSAGDRIRVYRTRSGSGSVIEEPEDETAAVGRADARDYDVDHYARVLRKTYAARLARAFTPGDFEVLLADPDQMSLFTPPIATIRTVLTKEEQAHID